MGEVSRYKEMIDYVNSLGHYAYRNSAGGRGRYKFGKKGQADISGILIGGRRLEIEVKEPNGTLSEDQVAFLLDISRRGGMCVVAVDISDVRKAFKSEGLV